MKLSTINLIVQSIMDEAEKTVEINTKEDIKRVANEATIYLKTALICEHKGIDEAMEYFRGDHTTFEYKEWLTSVVANTGPTMIGQTPDIDDVFICEQCNCMTKTTVEGFCGKCRRYKKLHINNLPKPH